jgi:hypothetical protein
LPPKREAFILDATSYDSSLEDAETTHFPSRTSSVDSPPEPSSPVNPWGHFPRGNQRDYLLNLPLRLLRLTLLLHRLLEDDSPNGHLLHLLPTTVHLLHLLLRRWSTNPSWSITPFTLHFADPSHSWPNGHGHLLTQSGVIPSRRTRLSPPTALSTFYLLYKDWPDCQLPGDAPNTLGQSRITSFPPAPGI